LSARGAADGGFAHAASESATALHNAADRLRNGIAWNYTGDAGLLGRGGPCVARGCTLAPYAGRRLPGCISRLMGAVAGRWPAGHGSREVLMSDLMSEARERTRADLAYESLYCAAIGGSVIALFFLVIDAYNGHPLFTPSLLGGVLFGRQAAETI